MLADTYEAQAILFFLLPPESLHQEQTFVPPGMMQTVSEIAQRTMKKENAMLTLSRKSLELPAGGGQFGKRQ